MSLGLTMTKQGLTVTAVKDSKVCPTGIPRLRRRLGHSEHQERAFSWGLELYHPTTGVGTFISVRALHWLLSGDILAWLVRRGFFEPFYPYKEAHNYEIQWNVPSTYHWMIIVRNA